MLTILYILTYSASSLVKGKRTEDVYTASCLTTDSHVAVRGDLDIWNAIMGSGREEPAQKAVFLYFNLKEELNKAQ
jgi:hypothetical protein